MIKGTVPMNKTPSNRYANEQLQQLLPQITNPSSRNGLAQKNSNVSKSMNSLLPLKPTETGK